MSNNVSTKALHGILTEAARIIAFFGLTFISDKIDFMTLIDAYKKMECSLMKVSWTKSGKRAHSRSSKTPAIIIPAYNSKITEVDTYMNEVKLAFQVQGAGEYLTDKLVCTENSQWSHEFMANIVQSIVYNGKLGHLAINNEE